MTQMFKRRAEDVWHFCFPPLKAKQENQKSKTHTHMFRHTIHKQHRSALWYMSQALSRRRLNATHASLLTGGFPAALTAHRAFILSVATSRFVGASTLTVGASSRSLSLSALITLDGTCAALVGWARLLATVPNAGVAMNVLISTRYFVPPILRLCPRHLVLVCS